MFFYINVLDPVNREDMETSPNEMDQEPNNLNLNILEEVEEEEEGAEEVEEEENIEENLLYLQDQEETNGEEEEEERENDENEEIRWDTPKPNRYSFVNYEYLQNVAGVGSPSQKSKIKLKLTEILLACLNKNSSYSFQIFLFRNLIRSGKIFFYKII